MAYSVVLEGGSPWGFRLQGGKDFKEPLKIAKLNPNSKAYNQGVKVGDYLDKINGTSTASLKHNDALQLIRNANNKLELELRRSETTRKKSVIPEIRINGPSVNGTTSQTNGNLSDSDYYYSSCDEEGIVRTNAITNYHSSSGSAGSAGHLSDGDGSSSGSQSSVVHVVGPYKGPLADKMKNISNSSSSTVTSSTAQPDGSGSKEKATPQTTVWSPFGVNKVRTYKPVSFSIIGGATSPASTNQNTAAFKTSSSFVGSTQQNVGVGSASATATTTAASTVTVTKTTTECKELGNTSANNETFSSPSYSNFNGSSSVIINASSPGSAYTSITMNSRKVTDTSPTHQYSTMGSPVRASSPSPSRPFSPSTPQSPIKTPSSPIKSIMSPSSPLKSPFAKGYKSVTPPAPAVKQPAGESQATGPAGPSFQLGSPPKPAAQLGSPTQPAPGPQLAPTSPTKSPKSTKTPQHRPSSPTKTVTFGPVTSLEKKPEEMAEEEEPRLSVSQKKSLFEQRQQQLKPTSPVTAPKRFATPNAPKPFKAQSTFGEKSSPPSNITTGTGYRPVSPRLFSPSRPGTKPLASPYAPPKSPPMKSKGLEMFLTLQRKLHEPDEELSEFTDSEEVTMPKSAAPVTPAKSTVSSPVIGRAVPIKITSQIRDEQDAKSDLGLVNSIVKKPLSGIKSPTSPVTSESEPWMPSKASALIDAELREREREREQQKLGSEFLDHNKLDSWSPTGGTETSHSQYTALKLNTSQSTTTETKSDLGTSKPGRSFTWKPDQTTTFSSSTVTTTTTTTMATHHTPSTTMSYSSHNGSISHHTESKLPTYQSPTITLLQKSRESEVPKEAILVGTKETIEGDKKHMDTYYLLPGDKDHTRSRRIVERKTTKYEGIGPTDEATGVPIIPRGSVDEKAHKDWYRRMYKSLHKVEKQEDDRKALSDSEDINNYKPTYVFPELDTDSEVEESNPYHPTYEFSAFSDTEGLGSTMSMDRGGYGRRSYTLPHARYGEKKYKVQPMSIENYEPGFSSIAFRERKVAGEPVKPPERQPDKKPHSAPSKDDKKSYLYNPPIEKPGQFSKYIYSDSEPELKKKDQPLLPQSDVESREAYKRIQKGGDIPYEGLHFPAPPKKDDENSDPKQESASTILQSRLQKHVRSKSSSSIIRSNTPSQSAVERLGIKSPPPRGLASTLKDHAQTTTQSNIPRQRHSVSGTGHSPTGSWDNRRRRDEEAARRKQEMKRITAQEKLKRMEEERKANEARRHNDFLTPSQKSPIPLNRYDDVPDISDLQRPKKKVGTQYRGKARALYNFKAQNPKELSFKKNDIIYLLRQIDKNWYEGEHHGLVGLFPVNYVEVLMSLDEARQAAILREGHAKAKYNFTAQSAMEVSFKKGDTVSLIRRIDNNWFEGRVNGRHGIFPVSYVEVLREPDTPLPTPMSSYAPTPATGSPGQLSPVSTISNGPAPTIPSAPISPRSSVDNFDFGQPFNYSQYPSSTTSLQRPSRRDQSYADYGLDPLNPMRPASALGGLSDGYGTVPRDRYNQANRPNSAVPFSDYLKNSARDSGFYSSEESRYSRQKHREEELMRSLSNPYEGRQSSAGSQSRDSFSRGEELRYPPYQALYSYRPQNPDELELREGDIVYVMEKCDDDWYVGTSQRTKEFGTFPGNYVRQL